MLSRLAMIALAMIVASPFGAGPAHASGCHVPDRPILSTRFTWERDRPVDPAGLIDGQAPPVLTRVPCSGEVPQLPGSPTGLVAQADRTTTHFDPPTVSEPAIAGDDIVRIDPHPFRLDRPPRLRRSIP
jgi:hypothetical protein